jgi:hypothetical protein
MFRIILFFILFLEALNSFSQIPTGQWRMHIATKSIAIASNNDLVYAIMDNGLIEYDIKNSELSEWSKVNGLSDINPSAIYYDKETNSFFIGYKNGNIDRIKDNVVTNIPALKLASVSGKKQINAFKRNKNLIYVSTGLGVLVLNPSKNEVKDTYYPNQQNEEILDVAFQNDSIIVLTKNFAKIAHVNNTSLVDFQQWKNYQFLPNLSSERFFKHIKKWNDELFIQINDVAYANDSIYRITSNGLVNVIDLPFGIEINRFDIINDKMYLSMQGGVFVYNKAMELIETHLNQFYNAIGVTVSNNSVFIAEENNVIYESSSAGLKNLKHNGPPKNSFFTVKSNNNKMLFAGGTLSSAAAIDFNSAGAYIFENENWTLIDRYNQNLWKDKFIWDVLSITVNPKNTNQIAMGLHCDYPLAIMEDGKNISTIYNEMNSLIEETHFQNGWSCITDVLYDDDENLWMLNAFSKKPLKVKTKNNEWFEFPISNNIINSLTGKILIDENNIKWFYVPNKGLYAFSDGGTLNDESDDKVVHINEGDNTGALPSKNVTSIAMDLNNQLWIGTEKGFGILNNTANILEALPGEYNVNRIKLQFEGNVEYLLGNVYITDIVIDGGNRKWIGTANSGIVLISENGNEILQTFTTDNSPLISNNIMDMEFNHQTGELFIVTDLGLVSYRSDASIGKNDYKDVSVFPNPVLPSFDGLITIQGIKANSDVKFTDIAGNLVFQTTSNGGTAVWNGKNLKGEKVAPGTYLIWTASNVEKGRKVGKVVVLN